VHDGKIVNGNDSPEHPLSLQRLRSGASAETKAIDDSTRYIGWSDFVATLEAIVTSEIAPGSALNLHIAELLCSLVRPSTIIMCIGQHVRTCC
jgi:hypothetical protein